MSMRSDLSLLRLGERGEYSGRGPLVEAAEQAEARLTSRNSQLLDGAGLPSAAAVLVSTDDVRAVVTAWELTEAEVADVVASGRVWLEIRGITQPPVVSRRAVHMGTIHLTLWTAARDARRDAVPDCIAWNEEDFLEGMLRSVEGLVDEASRHR
jgi:hypothetical protein